MVELWAAWAVLRRDGSFGNVGWKPYCEAHASARDGESVVPVIATEVTDAAERTHWSWADTGEDTPEWCLTWPSEAQFQVCFPYGLDAAVIAGNGRPLWLKVVAAE